MNKVLLLGRLTREPEVRYKQGGEPMAVARYTLAVNRKLTKNGQQEADFINCVAFGKLGEFANKYLRKGQLISVVGRLQVRSWDDQNGQKRWSTEVVIEEHYFAESKRNYENKQPGNETCPEGFYPIDESLQDDDVPF